MSETSDRSSSDPVSYRCVQMHSITRVYSKFRTIGTVQDSGHHDMTIASPAYETKHVDEISGLVLVYWHEPPLLFGWPAVSGRGLECPVALYFAFASR